MSISDQEDPLDVFMNQLAPSELPSFQDPSLPPDLFFKTTSSLAVERLSVSIETEDSILMGLASHPHCSISSRIERGQKEPTLQEKKDILSQILGKDPAIFLERYGKHLTPLQLDFFEQFEDNYEVNFYLKKLRRSLLDDDNKRKTQVRNRRFQYVEELARESDYFSDENMQKRDPLLYYRYIGKFETQKTFPSDMKVSERLLCNFDESELQKKRKVQRFCERHNRRDSDEEDDEEEEEEEENVKEEEEEQFVEEEEEEEEEEEAIKERVSSGRQTMSKTETEEVARIDSKLLREEFLELMKQRFIDGEDAVFFDYSLVDNNDRLNDTQHQQDQEDHYFDADE